MKSVRVKSYAKVNLNLNVGGRTGNYHALDTVAASIELFDAISLRARKDKRVTFRCSLPELETGDNNAERAARAFLEKYGTNGADIFVRKGIPVGGGLGGSSADVAGTLRGMAKLYGIKDDLAPLAAELSSDGVFQLRGGYGRLRGKGDDVAFADSRAFCYILLVMPEEGVRTADVFAEFDRTGVRGDPERTDRAWRALVSGDFAWLAQNLANDLFAPACALCGEIAAAYADVAGLGPSGAVMSGSGSTVLAMFESKELVFWAASKLKRKYRVAVSKLLPAPRM